METGNRHTRVFPARMSALPEIDEFIADVCVRSGLARESRFRLSVLVEELFTNTVRHGHGRDTDEPVVLVLETVPGRMTAIYEDTAPPHNPFAASSPPSTADANVGGVGVRLIAGMSTPEYRYADGRNRICLVIDAS
jgi:anti-sigma regulatory factor (Ser/Thr protein kinase)